MKKLKEWFIDAPWGKLALISWGNPTGEPVLLIHGRQDSSATFIPLLEYLPDTKYYVGVDLPGHGWSDSMPKGVMLTRLHFVEAVVYALKHLGWKRFTFVAHSMGCELGIFYNIFYPNRIKEFIFLDAVTSFQRIQIHDFQEYYKLTYYEYYSNYKNYNHDGRFYTKKGALEAVMRSRNLNEELAEVVLSRNLWPVGEDKYRLSWERRLKITAPQNYPTPYYYDIFSINLPPTLMVTASQAYIINKRRRKLAEELVKKMVETLDVEEDVVEGGHDVHLTHPEEVGRRVVAFMNRAKAKL